MLQSFLVDANNDLYLDGNGNLAISTDLQSVLEICAQVSKTILGELVLNTDKGIPYFETVFNGSPNFQQFVGALRAANLAVTGVTDISSLSLSQEGDNLIYVMTIVTIYGSGVVTNG